MEIIYDCLLNSCPEENFPPMPLPIPSTIMSLIWKGWWKEQKRVYCHLLSRWFSKTTIHCQIVSQHVNRPFIHSIRKFHHARNHQCRALSLSRWGTTRPIVCLLERRQMDGKRTVGNLTRSTARWHDEETLERGAEPTGASTSFGGRGKSGVQMRMSSAEITIGLRGNGRAWRAPSWDATDYCCRRRFAR